MPVPRPATKAEFHKMPPQIADGKAKTWITRGGNFAVAVSEVEPGAVLDAAERPRRAHDHRAAGGPTLSIEAGGKSIEAKADSLTIVPPGASKITAASKGLFARIFSKASQDIIALASNAATYADGAPELAPPDLWPAPHDGYRLRHYPLAQYAKPNGDRIQPRVFRSTNMLVNLFVHYQTRRDTTGAEPALARRFRAGLAHAERPLDPPHALQLGSRSRDLAAGRSRRDDDAVGHHHPGDRGAHEPRRRGGRVLALRHLLPAAPRLRAQEGLRHQRGRIPAARRAGRTTRSRPAAACSPGRSRAET